MRRIGVILLFFMASCTPEQRLSALLKRHPELIKHDTVFRIDTIRVDAVSMDTVLKNTVTKDTIVIKQDKLTIKYFNSKDSIFIYGKCDSIIKLVNVPVTVNSVSVTPQSRLEVFWNKTKDVLILLMLGAILIMAIIVRGEKKAVS